MKAVSFSGLPSTDTTLLQTAKARTRLGQMPNPKPQILRSVFHLRKISRHEQLSWPARTAGEVNKHNLLLSSNCSPHHITDRRGMDWLAGGVGGGEGRSEGHIKPAVKSILTLTGRFASVFIHSHEYLDRASCATNCNLRREDVMSRTHALASRPGNLPI